MLEFGKYKPWFFVSTTSKETNTTKKLCVWARNLTFPALIKGKYELFYNCFQNIWTSRIYCSLKYNSGRDVAVVSNVWVFVLCKLTPTFLKNVSRFDCCLQNIWTSSINCSLKHNLGRDTGVVSVFEVLCSVNLAPLHFRPSTNDGFTKNALCRFSSLELGDQSWPKFRFSGSELHGKFQYGWSCHTQIGTPNCTLRPRLHIRNLRIIWRCSGFSWTNSAYVQY